MHRDPGVLRRRLHCWGLHDSIEPSTARPRRRRMPGQCRPLSREPEVLPTGLSHVLSRVRRVLLPGRLHLLPQHQRLLPAELGMLSTGLRLPVLPGALQRLLPVRLEGAVLPHQHHLLSGRFAATRVSERLRREHGPMIAGAVPRWRRVRILTHEGLAAR